MATMAKALGCRGVLCDGPARDFDEIREIISQTARLEFKMVDDQNPFFAQMRDGLDEAANIIMDRYRVLADSSDLPGTSNITPFGAIDDEMHGGIRDILVEVAELGRLPVVTFCAGGIATPADASLMMQMGVDGIFVGSGVFKADDPKTMADAIVLATAHYDDPDKVAEAMSMMEGAPMRGDELETLEVRLDQRGW